MSEKRRILSKTDDVVTALRFAGAKGMTNGELSNISLRYGGIIGYLRKKGYSINTENIGNGLFRYILISEPKNHIEKKNAYDALIDKVKESRLVSAEGLQDLLDELGVTVRYKAGTH